MREKARERERVKHKHAISCQDRGAGREVKKREAKKYEKKAPWRA
jgi:hypothetical protein